MKFFLVIYFLVSKDTVVLCQWESETWKLVLSNELLKVAGIFCRLQVAGCRLKFNYNWKTAGTKNNE